MKVIAGVAITLTAATLIAVLQGIVIVIFSSYSLYIAAALQWFIIVSIDTNGGIGPLLIAVFLGAAAYIIRIWMRPLYAAIEIFFGTYGTGVALYLLYKPKMLPTEFQALASSKTVYPLYIGLGSTIFVTIRGIDNWISLLTQASRQRLRPDTLSTRAI